MLTWHRCIEVLFELDFKLILEQTSASVSWYGDPKAKDSTGIHQMSKIPLDAEQHCQISQKLGQLFKSY